MGLTCMPGARHAQEESSDLLAVGDAANAKLRMLEDRTGVVVQARGVGASVPVRQLLPE